MGRSNRAGGRNGSPARAVARNQLAKLMLTPLHTIAEVLNSWIYLGWRSK